MSDIEGTDKSDTTDPALLSSLKQLRDDIRVRIHLGGMELRDQFEKIEREADHLVAKVPPAASRAIDGLATRLRNIAHALDGKK